MKTQNYTVAYNEKGYDIFVNSMPTLYRYREIKDYTVEALLKNEVWGSTPSSFNDPYDSLLCFSRSKIIKELSKRICGDRLKKYLGYFKLSTKDELIEMFIKAFDFVDFGRSEYCVASFSEKVDREIMWAHYADNSRGFVLAYDGRSIKNMSDEMLRNTIDILQSKMVSIDFSELHIKNQPSISPVLYLGGKNNCTNIIIDKLDIMVEEFDNLANGMDDVEANYRALEKLINYQYQNDERMSMAYSALFNKSKDWEYEKEWRIWNYNMNVPQQHMLLGKLKPVAIYLGEKISKYNEIALIKIAKDILEIPIYKMKTKIYKHNCKLVPVEL